MKTKHNLALSLFLSSSLLFGAASLVACGDKASKDDKAESKDKDDKDKKDDKSAKASGSAAPGSAAPTGAGKPAPTGSSPTAASGTSAAAHLPAGCGLAMTLDMAKVWAHPAVAKDITPKLEAILSTPASKPEPKKFQEMLKELNLGPKSLSSVALCVGVGGADKAFSLFVGGDLKPNTLLPAFKKLVEAEGKGKEKDFQEVDGNTVLTLNDDFVGQYSDGVLGISDTLELWKSGSATGTNAAGYKLAQGHDLGLYLAQSTIEKELMKGRKGDELFKEMKEVTAFVDLGTRTVNLRISCKDAEGAKKLDAMISLAKGELMKDTSKVPFGLDKALKDMTQKLDGTDLVFESQIPEESLNTGIAALAAQLDKAKSTL